jgi:hypothetical protein
MIAKSLEAQAREYVYDVKNCASEFGQNTVEGWEVSLVTDTGKTKIEKDYYPTVSANPAHETLVEMLKLVKAKLLLPLSKSEYDFDINSATHKDIRHLIAFNPKMHR